MLYDVSLQKIFIFWKVTMFSKKEDESVMSKTLTIIAEGVTVEGKIFSQGSTRVDGKVNGEIISEKEFIIGKEGKINATVKTANAIISGYFKGEMIASGEVEITATGRFIGNLIQKDALLTISKGGLFKGESIISDNQEIFKKEIPEKSKTTEHQKEPVRPINTVSGQGPSAVRSAFSFNNPGTSQGTGNTGEAAR